MLHPRPKKQAGGATGPTTPQAIPGRDETACGQSSGRDRAAETRAPGPRGGPAAQPHGGLGSTGEASGSGLTWAWLLDQLRVHVVLIRAPQRGPSALPREQRKPFPVPGMNFSRGTTQGTRGQ